MADISFQTDQSGANSEICSTASSTFNFSVSSAYTATYASFVMKRGSGSTGSVTVAIYNGANASGSVVASVSTAAAAFSQTYTTMTFTFPANTNLTANATYSLKISSATACGGSNAYFIKAGSFQVLSSAATVLSVGYGLSAPIAGQTTLSGSARAGWGISAEIAASTAVAGATTANIQILAALLSQADAVAALSKISLGETNFWYHGYALIDGIYLGTNRVRKAYLGSTLVLDQPT